MFHFPLDPHWRVPEAILSELRSALTNKLTFLICPHYVYLSPYDVLSGPETLLVTYNSWEWALANVNMLPEILNKRWLAPTKLPQFHLNTPLLKLPSNLAAEPTRLNFCQNCVTKRKRALGTRELVGPFSCSVISFDSL